LRGLQFKKQQLPLAGGSGKARRLPFAHGVGARRGTLEAREAGRWRPFRGSRFSLKEVGSDREERKSGGPKTREGAPLPLGSRARCAEEEGSRRAFSCGRPAEESRSDVLPVRSSRSLGGATPKKGEDSPPVTQVKSEELMCTAHFSFRRGRCPRTPGI